MGNTSERMVVTIQCRYPESEIQLPLEEFIADTLRDGVDQHDKEDHIVVRQNRTEKAIALIAAKLRLANILTDQDICNICGTLPEELRITRVGLPW